eukprot:COSAG06_NODE_624_length_13686_cov_86.804666_19_plen_118_part_00
MFRIASYRLTSRRPVASASLRCKARHCRANKRASCRPRMTHRRRRHLVSHHPPLLLLFLVFLVLLPLFLLLLLLLLLAEGAGVSDDCASLLTQPMAAGGCAWLPAPARHAVPSSCQR